ncbi:adenine phosphoribosyltransferase [Methanococcus voltae]|nr:adenine phosphoribosyltransferase [Methanococcus voltae]MBP2142916.1 adenine phosphoribosyltransferase [Methanococcus voltae]
MSKMDLKKEIRVIEDFPKKGVSFKDVTTILKSPKALKYTIDEMSDYIEDKKVDVIVGPEARGFLFGVPIASKLNLGFVPVRKSGKLPFETHNIDYDLEYGTDKLEVHVDGIQKGQKVAVVDDLLATGGTALATSRLMEKVGGEIACLNFIIELTELEGRKKLNKYDIQSLVTYEI